VLSPEPSVRPRNASRFQMAQAFFESITWSDLFI
jgi:hypothetical protein